MNEPEMGESPYASLRQNQVLIHWEMVDREYERHTYGQCWPLFYHATIYFQTVDHRVLASTLVHEFIHLDGLIRDESQVRYAQNLVDEWLWGQSSLDLLILGHTKTEQMLKDSQEM